jgi:adenosine deaminase
MTLELAKCYSGSLLEGLRTHPQLSSWIKKSHPFSIGTDDPGVFHTNATKELMLVQKAFDLEAKTMYGIVLDSMDHAFCNSETRKMVKARLEQRVEQLSTQVKS